MKNDESSSYFQHVTHPRGLFGPGAAPTGGLNVVPVRAHGSRACGAKGPAKARSLRASPKRVLTFLSDADGATAHSHPQGIYTSINEVLGLSSCDHCKEEQGKAHMKVYVGA